MAYGCSLFRSKWQFLQADLLPISSGVCILFSVLQLNAVVLEFHAEINRGKIYMEGRRDLMICIVVYYRKHMNMDRKYVEKDKWVLIKLMCLSCSLEQNEYSICQVIFMEMTDSRRISSQKHDIIMLFRFSILSLLPQAYQKNFNRVGSRRVIGCEHKDSYFIQRTFLPY